VHIEKNVFRRDARCEQGAFAGLDQINALLPTNLSGRGEVDVEVTVDGQSANTVRLSLK
jgi:uncharacterized protein (TIGR03437 family)